MEKIPRQSLLTIKKIYAGYGAIQVLKGISLEIRQGEIVTLIGANGAGKTTTLMCIAGIIPLQSGQIFFKNSEIQNVPAHRLVSQGLAQVPEGRKIFPRLTVLENLEMGAFLRTNKQEIAADKAKVFHLFPILQDRQHQVGGTLSGGEQQMLAIGRALMSRPQLLLMDEPSMGIAPLLVLKIYEAIRSLNQAGMTILLVEQNARLALKYAHRGYVLETGSIILTDNTQNLLTHPKVVEAYLGEI